MVLIKELGFVPVETPKTRLILKLSGFFVFGVQLSEK